METSNDLTVELTVRFTVDRTAWDELYSPDAEDFTAGYDSLTDFTVYVQSGTPPALQMALGSITECSGTVELVERGSP